MLQPDNSRRQILSKTEILVECPWRERPVRVPWDHPLLVRSEPSELDTNKELREFDLNLLRPTAAPLDPEQAKVFRFEIGAEGSGALQARTGSGKSIIAMYLTAYFLKRFPDKHVVLSCPTKLILSQLGNLACGHGEINGLFAEPHEHVARIAHLSSDKRRQVYELQNGKLIIGSASMLAIDIANEKVDPSRISLVIIDEAHLTRKQEAGAILRNWCKANNVRTFQCSATLTRTPKPFADEIATFMDEAGVQRFTQLSNRFREAFTVKLDKIPPLIGDAGIREHYKLSARNFDGQEIEINSYPKDGNPNAHLCRGANYEVPDPQYLPLTEEIASAARLIARDMNEILLATEATLKDDNRDEAEQILTVCRRLIAATNPDKNTLVPSAPSFHAFCDALSELAKPEIGEVLASSYAKLKKDCFSLITLGHLHQLITTQPRVGFLEFAGRILFQARIGKSKAHHQSIFEAGRPPKWWVDMSRSTPYTILNELLPNDPEALVLQKYLAQRGVDVTDAKSAAEQFFSNPKRGLGLAAKDLLTSVFTEHPKVGWTIATLEGSIRRQNPGQALIYCAEVIPTLYLTEKLNMRAGARVVPLVGHSSLNATLRNENYTLAAAGSADACCTSVGGLGIDLCHLRYLLVLEPSADLREVEQLWGRVGRKEGSKGTILITGTKGYRDAVRDYAREAQQGSLDVLPRGQVRRYEERRRSNRSGKGRRSDSVGQQFFLPPDQ